MPLADNNKLVASWQELNYDCYMQKGTAPLFIIIAGLLVIGLIGVFALGLTKSPVTEFPLKITTPAPVSLTYQNQNLGFEFRYSVKGFTAKEDSEEEFNKRGNGDFRKNFKGYVGYEPGKSLGAAVVLDKANSFNNSPFAVWVFDNPGNLTVDGWFDKYWYYPYLWGVFDWTSKGHVAPDKEATISGTPAKYKIVVYQPGQPKFVYISKDKKMYLIRAIGESGDKILSTFKFLN